MGQSQSSYSSISHETLKRSVPERVRGRKYVTSSPAESKSTRPATFLSDTSVSMTGDLTDTEDHAHSERLIIEYRQPQMMEIAETDSEAGDERDDGKRKRSSHLSIDMAHTSSSLLTSPQKMISTTTVSTNGKTSVTRS